MAPLSIEQRASEIEYALRNAKTPLVSSSWAEYESVMAVARELGAKSLTHAENIELAILGVRAFFDDCSVTLAHPSENTGSLALRAAARYGKGSGHPAKLTMGDCFSYARARMLGVPLLFVGDDFNHTDVESALTSQAL